MWYKISESKAHNTNPIVSLEIWYPKAQKLAKTGVVSPVVPDEEHFRLNFPWIIFQTVVTQRRKASSTGRHLGNYPVH
jgi:hypothetical protein